MPSLCCATTVARLERPLRASQHREERVHARVRAHEGLDRRGCDSGEVFRHEAARERAGLGVNACDREPVAQHLQRGEREEGPVLGVAGAQARGRRLALLERERQCRLRRGGMVRRQRDAAFTTLDVPGVAHRGDHIFAISLAALS